MIISSPTTGMGDILLLTAVAKYFPEAEVHLQPSIQKYARFFRNICSKIVITENITPLKEEGSGHYALRKLRPMGLSDRCYLPYVSYSQEELIYGKELIKTYVNPIVFVSNSSLQWKHEREPPQTYFQNIINQLYNEGHTILQFGLSKNFTEYKHVIPLIDIDIDTLICYYAAIGRYVGVDTGDTHLMLAVGGQCQVFIPSFGSRVPSEWNYNSSKINYFYFN